MASDCAIQAPAPRHVCGYELVRWLKEGRTALCRSDANRLLVLKKLDQDCLLEGDLHPDVRERLARIRELAHGQVATLISVERDAQGAVYAVWQYIAGVSFEAWACNKERDQRQVARMMRELVLAVEAMHGQGIVHGCLHGGNIMVDEGGVLRLLDVSPLLFSDPQDDAAAMAKLFEAIVHCRGEKESLLGAGLIRQTENRAALSDFSKAISRMIQPQDLSPAQVAEEQREEQTRRRALRWALTCALTAAVLAMAGWWAFSHSVAAPPEAPVEALKPR